MKRRALIGGVGGAALAGLAGCLGTVGMDYHEATPGGVSADAREETGYEQIGVEEIVIEESADLFVTQAEVEAVNYLTEHEKTVSFGPLMEQPAAVFFVLTTPQISILGQELNPIEDMSSAELIELVEDNYDDISNVRHDEDETVTILDQETTHSRFEADATFDGYDHRVDIHVSESIQTDDSHLVTIGVHPQELRGQEEGNVRTLVEAVIGEIDQDAEAPADDDGNGDDEADGNGDDEADGNGDGDGNDDEDDGLNL